MGSIKKHLPVKLFAALTYQASFDPDALYHQLENRLKSIEIKSDPYDFGSFTAYYEDEMGRQLKKEFIVFQTLIDPSELPDIKRWTNKIEQSYCLNKKRRVNIDPGYLTQAKLVLATTKNYSHRLYLEKGIFGDVHMQFQKGTYQPNPWTYPDYMAPETIRFFNQVRENYLKQLANILPRTENPA